MAKLSQFPSVTFDDLSLDDDVLPVINDNANKKITIREFTRSLNTAYSEYIKDTSATLTANECLGGLINNYGQTSDTEITLPECASGMNFKFVAGSVVASFYQFTPDAGNYFIVDGIIGDAGKYIQADTLSVGDSIVFEAIQTGVATWNWFVTTGLGSWTLEE